MQAVLVKYLTEKLDGLPYISKVYGLGALVNKGEGQFPAVYPEKGNELMPIPFDSYRALTFILPNGKADTEPTDHPFLGCVDRSTETYPFKLILYSQGSENVNCSSHSQNVANGLRLYLSGVQNAFKTAIGLENANINITAVDVDKNAVWNTLYNTPVKLKDNDILIAIEFEFEIQGVLSCFLTQPCDVVSFTYDANFTTLCQKVNECMAIEVIKITAIDFTGNTYVNHAKLANKTPDIDFTLYSDEGTGGLLKVNDGYSYNVLGEITPIPEGVGNYRLVIYS